VLLLLRLARVAKTRFSWIIPSAESIGLAGKN